MQRRVTGVVNEMNVDAYGGVRHHASSLNHEREVNANENLMVNGVGDRMVGRRKGGIG